MTDVAMPGVGAEPVRHGRSGVRWVVWLVGIVVIGGMLMAVLVPSLCRPRETALRVKCASNLKQVGMAILLYTGENGGQYPPSLSVLVGTEDIGGEVMVCPSSNDERSAAIDTAGIIADVRAAEAKAAGHKACLSYVYVGRGMTVATASAGTVVAYESLENHDGDGTNVLFGDGRTEWVGKKEWPRVAKAGGLSVDSAAGTRP